MTETLQQGTDAWHAARIGFCSASRIADVMAKTKTGYSASRDNYKAQLVTEILTGIPQGPDLSNNPAVQWGIQKESDARAAYELRKNVLVRECGFFRHPTIERSGASPDGLIGENGVLEIKCPESKTHIEYLKAKEPPRKYLLQMMWQMECTGREFADFVSYDPRMPERLQLLIVRVPRDDDLLETIRAEVIKFLDEVRDEVANLSS